MNWPIRKNILFIFTLLTIISCENPAIDIGLQEDNPLNTTFTDTISVKASTVLVNDSILALQKSNLYVGSYFDNTFGKITSKAFLEIGLESGTTGSTFTGAPNATVDSVVLALDYDEYYGDTTQDLTLQVHRLTQGFDERTTYFTNTNLPAESNPLGTKTFKPRPRKTLEVERKERNAAGEVTSIKKIKRSYPVRIRLVNSFATEVISKSGTSTLTNGQDFLKFLPGLAISASSNAKSIVGFNLKSAADSTYLTYMTIYYKSDGKPYKYNFIVNPGNFQFSQVSADRTGSKLANLRQSGDSVSSTATNNEVYLQESVGVKTKITFPHIHKIRAKLGDVAINRAELIIPVKTTADNTPSPFLYLFETNKRNKILRYNGSPKGLSSDGGGNLFNYMSPAVLPYLATNKTYSLNVTSYIQALIFGTQSADTRGFIRKPNKSLLLSPASFMVQPGTAAAGNDALSLQTLQQTVLSMDPSNRIKLRIFYSTKSQTP